MADDVWEQPSDVVVPGWRGELHMQLSRRGQRTVLERRWHRGPLCVLRPFHPEPEGTCHLVLVHPPGGLAGGDMLDLQVTLEPHASALITTPAATKLYRARRAATQRQRFIVGAGAQLEWLPQETLAFEGAQAQLATEVHLSEGSAFMGWEILCLGRPAAGEGFERGALGQRLELWREGRPLFIERARYEGGGASLLAAWGLQGRTAFGTFVCTHPEAARLVEPARAALPEGPHACAVTCLGTLLVARFLGDQAEHARRNFEALWHALRPAVLGRPGRAPRIWST